MLLQRSAQSSPRLKPLPKATIAIVQRRALRWRKQLGRPKIDEALEKRIQTQLRAGKGILKVAREIGVGTGTVQRIARELGPFDVAA
jgi:hypothetical protein